MHSQLAFGPVLNLTTNSSSKNSYDESSSTEKQSWRSMRSTSSNNSTSAESNVFGSEFTFSTASTNTLGSHWKRVATVHEGTTVSSNGTGTIYELSGATTNTYSSIPTEIKNTIELQQSYLHQLITIIESKKNELKRSLKKSTNLYIDHAREGVNIHKDLTEMFEEAMKRQESSEKYISRNAEDFRDTIDDMIELFESKRKVHDFVDASERLLNTATHTSLMIEANLKKAEKIRNMLDFNRMDFEPLTVYEKFDYRIDLVLKSLPAWIRSMPLNNAERQRIEQVMMEGRQNPQFDKKYKVDMVLRALLDIFSTWSADMISKIGSFQVHDCSSSQFTGTSCASSYEPTYLENSKSMSSSESSLNDLNQAIHNSKIQTAVDANDNISIESWPTASIMGWSDSTASRDSVQTVGEPMTLSSYVLSSDEEASAFNESLKTALSQDDMLIPQPPRSPNKLTKDDEDVLDFRQRIPTLSSVSSISLAEMVDEALATAKETVGTRAHDLYTALQNSANKCGVAVSNLMSTTSSAAASSEDLSSTQGTQSSKSH